MRVREGYVFVSSEIGRGHPFYLDGVADSLAESEFSDLVCARHGVFDLSRGPARSGWRAVRALYRLGGLGAVGKRFYEAVRGVATGRAEGRSPSLSRFLGAGWARTLAGKPVVVDHPLLVATLSPWAVVWYVHGEVVVPPECLRARPFAVFVPLAETAREFHRAFGNETRVYVTGLCVERGLVGRAPSAFEERVRRLSGTGPLTAALFGSGAEPTGHVRLLALAARSLRECGQRVFAFAREGGRFHRALSSGRLVRDVELALFRTRKDLENDTVRLLPCVDVLVAPAHERTAWALGLGLPMFVLSPDIGPFAPRNRQFLLARGVAEELRSENDARVFGRRLLVLREEGRLARMAEAGRGLPVDGFRVAAEILALVASGREEEAEKWRFRGEG